MKNQTGNLIIALLALVILVGGFFLLKSLPINDENAPETADITDDPYTLWDFKKEDFESLFVKNQEDEYTIISDGEGLVLEGLLGKRKEETSYSFIETIYKMQSTKTITDGAKNLSTFGLDKPELTLKISYKGGEAELLVGSVTPEKNSRYVLVKGDDNVYMVATSSLRPLFFDKFFYLSKKLSNLDPEKEYDINNLTLSIEGKKDMVIVKNIIDENSPTASYQSKYRLKEPVDHETISDKTAEFIETAINLVAMDIKAIDVKEEDYTKYGLDKPIAKVEALCYEVLPEASEEVAPTEVVSYIIGDETEDGMYYALEVGGSTVFLVAKDALSFINTSYTDYMSPLLFLPYINDVKEITIDLKKPLQSGKRRFNFVHSIEEIPGTETEEGKTNLTVTESGKEISDLTSYKTLYQVFIGVRGEMAASDEVINDNILNPPAVKITYSFFDKNRKDSVIELIAIDDRNLLISVNGEVHFTMRSAYLNKLISSIDTVLSGKELISSDW